MAYNVEVQFTGGDRFKPSKPKSGDKIDGISALLNALFDAKAGFISPET